MSQRALIHEAPLRVALIGCGAAKQGRAAPARELYTGPLFRAQLQHAERLFGENVLILSALHGALALDEEVEPYDVRLGRDTRSWGEMVASQLLFRFLSAPVEFHVLAGAAYVQPLRAHAEAHWTFVEPLAGLTQGRRLQALKKARAA